MASNTGHSISNEPISIEDWGLILNDRLVVTKLNFRDGEVILTVRVLLLSSVFSSLMHRKERLITIYSVFPLDAKSEL